MSQSTLPAITQRLVPSSVRFADWILDRSTCRTAPRVSSHKGCPRRRPPVKGAASAGALAGRELQVEIGLFASVALTLVHAF